MLTVEKIAPQADAGKCFASTRAMNDAMNGCKSCAEPGVITVNNELLCGLCFCRAARNEASLLRRGQGTTLQDVAKAATLIADLARYLRESAATMSER